MTMQVVAGTVALWDTPCRGLSRPELAASGGGLTVGIRGVTCPSRNLCQRPVQVKLLPGLELAAVCGLKTAELQVRPIHQRLADRVRAHLFLCMLAYYVEWHMCEAWRPLLFADEELAERRRTGGPVAPAEPSASARRKKATRTAADGTPAHSFRTLLEDLARVAHNNCRSKGEQGPQPCEFELDTQLNAEQTRAMELLKEIQI